jgi:hypothetical protein
VASHDAVAETSQIISDGIGVHGFLFLPGGLLNAGKLASEGVFPEAEAAELELAHVAPRPPANLAAIAVLSRELGLGSVFVDFCVTGHGFS